VLWIAGGLDPDPVRRMLWWAGALAVEYAGPLTFFAIPGLGRSTPADWDISGEHMAERCSLFIIICLGEGILVTGSTIGGMEPDMDSILGFISAFVGSVAMWWIYFDVGARRGTEMFHGEYKSGLIGREVYTYFHIPIVAGIIILAVADELVISHPDGHLDPFFVTCLIAGALLFIGGTMTFKRLSSAARRFPLSHLVGVGLFALLGAWAILAHPEPLRLHIAASIILVVVAIWEWGSFHGGWVERWKRIFS
jgi:low temperature requirement protein LtrA